METLPARQSASSAESKGSQRRLQDWRTAPGSLCARPCRASQWGGWGSVPSCEVGLNQDKWTLIYSVFLLVKLLRPLKSWSGGGDPLVQSGFYCLFF